MSHLSETELLMLDLSDLPRDTPFIICHVCQTQFSIARHYGGCKFQGRNYTYIQETDELLRDDVVKWLAKHRKAQRKVGGSDTAIQGDLLLPANAKSTGAARHEQDQER